MYVLLCLVVPLLHRNNGVIYSDGYHYSASGVYSKEVFCPVSFLAIVNYLFIKLNLTGLRRELVHIFHSLQLILIMFFHTDLLLHHLQCLQPLMIFFLKALRQSTLFEFLHYHISIYIPVEIVLSAFIKVLSIILLTVLTFIVVCKRKVYSL